MIDRDTKLKASVLNSHAAQLRAEAMQFLFCCGEEYTTALNDAIAEAMDDENPNKRIFGMLAEIGFCSVFAEHALAAEDDHADL